MNSDRQRQIRALFDEYIEMYAARDDRLIASFSECFSGYTGGGDFLVKDRAEWVKITCQDFTQIKERLRIEVLDLTMQDLSADVVMVTAFFHIHLPIPDHILSRETARLVLVFRQENCDWKIVHSGISIPYHLVQDGEVYPVKSLQERNDYLLRVVEERTRALEEANLKLELLSNADGLTGIANRRCFDASLDEEWNRARRMGIPLALIMLDVDYFKHFNDQHGHLAGDDCLRALTKLLLKEVRRAGELVARYGGEEFVVLMPDSDLQAARDMAQRIQRSVRTLARTHAGVPTGIVSVSCGIASIKPSSHNSPINLLEQADRALYRAKAAGRDRIELTAA